MAEDKVTKNKDMELLEKRIEELEADLKKTYEIANGYIKAYNNLLGTLNVTVQTQADISANLQEKLK